MSCLEIVTWYNPSVFPSDALAASAVHVDGKIALILRASDADNAERILKANDIAILTLDEVKKFFQ